MISTIARQVILRYASQFLTNIDVNQLSIWGGEIVLQNVVLNDEQLTEVINLPFVKVKEGSIQNLELQIPWSALSYQPIKIRVEGISLTIDLAENSNTSYQIQQISEMEENWISKALANLILVVENLNLKIQMSSGAYYIGKISIKELIVQNANKQEFVNPYKPILGGTAFQIDKSVHISDLQLKILSGKPDEFISKSVLNHKFNKNQCKSCALCHGFKSSSYYTLSQLVPLSLQINSNISLEQSNISGKTRYIRVNRNVQSNQFQIHLLSPCHLKLNLKHDQQLIQDLLWLKSLMPTLSSKETVSDSYSDNSGWVSWGKDMILSPFYCSQPSGKFRIIDEVFTQGVYAQVQAPLILFTVKIYNPIDMEVLKCRISLSDASLNYRTQYSHSSEGSVEAQNMQFFKNQTKQVAIIMNLKQKYAFITLENAKFEQQQENSVLQLSNLFLQVMENQGIKSDAFSIPSLQIRILQNPGQLMQISLDPLNIQLNPSDLQIVGDVIYQLQRLDVRMRAVMNPEHSSGFIPLQLFSNLNKTLDKQTFFEQTIQNLQKNNDILNYKLEEAQQENVLLRKIINEVQGGAGFSQMLQIDKKSIILSVPGHVNGIEASIILTSNQLIFLTTQGRIIQKLTNQLMQRLEIQGKNKVGIRCIDGNVINIETEDIDALISKLSNINN